MTPKHKYTAVICCFNSRKRIDATLRHLEQVTVPRSAFFDVVVIDNASTDGTGDHVRSAWRSPHINLRVVFEPTPGLIHARARGIQEATGDTIAFIDDDNRVSPSYLCAMHAQFSSRPSLGVWGCRIHAEPEVRPPDWFSTLMPFYGVTSDSKPAGDTDAVIGAGMAVRKAVFEHFSTAQVDFVLSGRLGNQMTSGEDTEICYLAAAAGWDVTFDPTTEIKHFIPEGRLTDEYAFRLVAGIGDSSCPLGYYRMRLKTGPTWALARSAGTWMNTLMLSCNPLNAHRNTFLRKARRHLYANIERSWRRNWLTRIPMAEDNLKRMVRLRRASKAE